MILSGVSGARAGRRSWYLEVTGEGEASKRFWNVGTDTGDARMGG